jgi:hypothetical protein
MPNQILNDGSVVAGSRDLTIGGIVYATDDFHYDMDSNEILRTDKNTIPSGRKLTRGPTSGSATLQLATGSTVVPDVFATFVTTEGTFYLSKVGRAETKGGETKVPVSFLLAITGSIVVT